MSSDDARIARHMEYLVGRALGAEEQPTHEVTPTSVESIAEQLHTALRHQDAGTRLPGPTRFARIKRGFLRLLRLHAEEQAAFNRATTSALLMLNHNMTVLAQQLDTRTSRLRNALTALDALERDVAAQSERLHGRVVDVESTLAKVAGHEVTNRSDIAVIRARLDRFLHEMSTGSAGVVPRDDLDTPTSDSAAWIAPLYSQLEEAFRGSREEIRSRLEEYLPLVVELEPTAPVIDIGCGRGEWLELLVERGIAAYGVDNNKAFVEKNSERGLDVRYEDAISHLLTLEPGSVSAVTAFHLVEHLPFEDMVRLLDAALVALRPGGLLVVETPNPTNLLVGAAAFYLDPTHRNPIHPLFMQFLVEARGFTGVELRYLHPANDAGFALPDDRKLRMVVDYLNQVLFGPQDFAVIANKATRHA